MTLAIRPAAAHDYPAFLRLFPELAVPDPAPSLERFRDAIAPDALVALEGDEVVGVVWARKRGPTLHVVYLISDPSRRRLGIGRALMDAAAARARALGLDRWMLNVKPENVAARTLYERCGMIAVMSSASMRTPWDAVAALAPAPLATRVEPLTDDERVERALGLGHGELAAMRALPGRVFFAAWHDDEPVGVVGFDAAFPGASPFRVRDPRFARALLERVRSLARAEHDHLFVFVEGDAGLEAALATVGAVAALRTLRMEGAVGPSSATRET